MDKILSRRSLLLASSLLLLTAACAGPPQIPVSPDAPPFTLEGFFTGRTVGKGAFTSPIAGVNRPLTVITTGRWDGETLTLREDFVFADGEKDVKTWRFRKIGHMDIVANTSAVGGRIVRAIDGDRFTLT
jgi:hypothetical protein